MILLYVTMHLIYYAKIYLNISPFSVPNHVKLEIRSFFMNFNRRGFSLKGIVLMWGILAKGLADLWEIADLHCLKVQSTKWLKRKLRATLGGQ